MTYLLNDLLLSRKSKIISKYVNLMMYWELSEQKCTNFECLLNRNYIIFDFKIKTKWFKNHFTQYVKHLSGHDSQIPELLQSYHGIGWISYHGNSGVTQEFAKHEPTMFDVLCEIISWSLGINFEIKNR